MLAESTGEEMEGHDFKGLAQGHIVGKWWAWDSSLLRRCC